MPGKAADRGGKEGFARGGSWATLVVISTAYMAMFLTIQGFKAMLPFVQEDFAISRAQVGLYSSFYFFSAVLIAVFSGKVTDYLGTKRGLVLGVSIVAVMMFLHTLAPSFWLILLLALVTGAAFSVITPSVNKGVIDISAPQSRSIAMGIVHGGGGFGGFLGAVLLPFLATAVGWRPSLAASSVMAILVALFLARFYRPSSGSLAVRKQGPGGQQGIPLGTSTERKTEEGPAKTSLKDDLRYLTRNRYLLSIFAMGAVFGMNISSVTGHFAVFLARDLGTGSSFAGLGLGFFHIGGILGMPAWGLINDRFLGGDRRRCFLLLGFLVTTLGLLFGSVVSRATLAPGALLAICALFGFCIMGFSTIYFTAVSEQVPREKVGVVTGVALLFPRTSTVIVPPLFGLVADLTGTYALSWTLLGILAGSLTALFFFFSRKYLHQKL